MNLDCNPLEMKTILSGMWFQYIGQHMRSLVCVRVSAILWSIWFCKNDVTFDKNKIYSYLQVIFMAIFWTQFQNILQNGEQQITCEVGLSHIGDLAIEIFSKHGWSFFRRMSAQLDTLSLDLAFVCLQKQPMVEAIIKLGRVQTS